MALSAGARVINSLIGWNSNSMSYAGGGVYSVGGIISNCTVIANFGDLGGGGVWMNSGSMVVDSMIIGNQSESRGAGIWCSNSVVNRCIVESNHVVTTSDGGGIVCDGTSLVMNCIISGNYSRYLGAGVHIRDGGFALIRNCLIVSNFTFNLSTDCGGGLGLRPGATAVVDNCTIVSNFASDGGGVYCRDPSSLLVMNNSIIYFNDCYRSNANWSAVGNLYCTNCCVTPTNDLPGSGNLADNPGFVNYTHGDFHLEHASPCVNAGVNPGDSPDLDGRRRPDKFSGIIDMGCYEYLPGGCMFGCR